MIQRLTKFSWRRAAPVAGVVAGIGIVVVVVVVVRAAGYSVAFEPESGALTGGASTFGLSGASGGSIVKFSTGSTPTPTPPAPTATPTPSGGCPQPKHTVTAQQVSNQTNSGYPAGTLLYVPDGPDPWGGCFPGSGTTGIPAGTQLSSYSGPCTITIANTTINAKTINCSLIIRASNVTISNSKINAGDITIETGSFLLTDSEVALGNNINAEGLKGYNFTVRKTNMYGGKRQIWCYNNCTLENSYLHDQLSDPSGVTHESSARVQENTVFRHNTFWCNAPDFPPDAGCSANQTGYPDFTPIHGNTLDKNLYMATTGGYCSYGGATAGKPYSNDPLNATNIVATNNVFQRGTKPNDRNSLPLTDRNRYTCGYYGVTTAFDSGKSGFNFTGNMWDNGLLFSSDSSYPYGSFVD